MKHRFTIFATLLSTLFGTHSYAADGIDGSLDEIATQIVERTSSDGVPTIGISTFTHSDGTCSQLSNYITEFVVDSLFNAGRGNIEIIERSQLSAIFREMQLVYDGTIAPDTAKRLGEIEGVDAVVSGSLIEFGEQVKVQARLISTENGRLFATARSDFPNVGSISEMMTTRSRAACGFSNAQGAPLNAVEPEKSDNVAGGTVIQGLIGTDAPRLYVGQSFDAVVSSVRYNKSNGQASFSIRFKNKTENPIALSYVKSSLAVADGSGGFMNYSGNWSGIRQCYALNQPQYCNASDPNYATVVEPSKIAQLNFLTTGAKNLQDPKFTVSMELLVTPNLAEKTEYSVQSVGFFDISQDQ